MIEFALEMTVWHWLALAGVILVAELSTGTTYLLWPAAAALIAAATQAFLDLPLVGDLAVFAVSAIALTVAVGPFVRRRMNSGPVGLNERGRQIVGERARVVAPFEGGTGRVEVYGSQWRAVIDDTAIPPSIGAFVEVTAVEGATVTVRRIT